MPYLKSENAQLYYSRAGSGPPAIFLAGMSLDADVWEPVMQIVEQDILTIGMDLRGSGRSDAPRSPYSISQMATDVINMIIQLKLGRCLIVGHSLGGFVALQVALMRADLVAGLTLVSTSAVGQADLLGTSARAASVLSNTLGPFEEIARKTAHIGFGSHAKNKAAAAIEQFVTLRLARPPRGRGYVGQRTAAEKFDIRHKLYQIDSPSIVLHGDEDEIISPENGVALASEMAKASLCPLRGVGHFPQLEVPGLVAVEILDLSGRIFLR